MKEPADRAVDRSAMARAVTRVAIGSPPAPGTAG